MTKPTLACLVVLATACRAGTSPVAPTQQAVLDAPSQGAAPTPAVLPESGTESATNSPGALTPVVPLADLDRLVRAAASRCQDENLEDGSWDQCVMMEAAPFFKDLGESEICRRRFEGRISNVECIEFEENCDGPPVDRESSCDWGPIERIAPWVVYLVAARFPGFSAPIKLESRSAPPEPDVVAATPQVRINLIKSNAKCFAAQHALVGALEDCQAQPDPTCAARLREANAALGRLLLSGVECLSFFPPNES